jgi:hypothetical protein
MLSNNYGNCRPYFQMLFDKISAIDFVFGMAKNVLVAIAGTAFAFLLYSCKKNVEVDQPIDSLTSEGTFSTDATAISAVVGIYSKLTNSGPAFGNGGTTIFAGLSSDELTRVGISGDALQFYNNNLLTDNSFVASQLWSPAYYAIFEANSCIEGIEKSESLTPNLKDQLLGECKFLRAYAYFYLTNLWDNIPMPLTGDWSKSYLLNRTPKSQVYDQIVTDLKDAQVLLSKDYSFSADEKIRANKLVATAFLARVFLYRKEWANAEAQASAVINSGSYTLENNLNNVFLKNSSETILQFQPSRTFYPYAVTEANAIQGFPVYYLTPKLITAFEISDQRKIAWTKSTTVNGSTIFLPYKYKVRQGTNGGNISEYYMVLRFAEQFLIRAEARAQQNNISDAQSDINTIRNRAFGISNPTIANDQSSLLTAIEKERQVELFCEWGHRWFDLIRTNRADAVLGAIKGSNWQLTDQLYPIPLSELRRNPNLTQNPGYN